MGGVSVIPFVVSEVRLPPDEQVLLGREWWPSYAHAVVHPDGVFLFDGDRQRRDRGDVLAQWIDAPGLTYEVLDAETEVAPGLRLVPTPGHSPGHQSLIIEALRRQDRPGRPALQSKAEWVGGTDPSGSEQMHPSR